MALTSGAIPVLANVPNSGVAVMTGTTNGTQGSDSNSFIAYTAGAYGGRVYSLCATTNNTAAVNVFVYILRGATVIPIGMVLVALSSGNTSAARFNVDFLNGVNILGLPFDNAGNRYIPLMANDKLKCSTLVTQGALTTWVVAHGADYQP